MGSGTGGTPTSGYGGRRMSACFEGLKALRGGSQPCFACAQVSNGCKWGKKHGRELRSAIQLPALCLLFALRGGARAQFDLHMGSQGSAASSKPQAEEARAWEFPRTLLGVKHP